MKKITLLSLVAASVLFTACGENTETVTDTVEKTAKGTTETVTDTIKNAVTGSAKTVTDTVTETAKGATETVTETVKNAVTGATETVTDKVTETAKNATETVTDTVKNAVTGATKTVTEVVTTNTAGKDAYAKCAGCHGADGKTKALGKSEVIAGQSAADLESKLKEYKAGTRNVAGMGMLMKGQVASMSDDDIKAVSEYISAL